jgi:hypothetical protein
MLLVPLVLSTVPETICSKFLQMKDQNVLKHHQARTKTESLSADPHLATTLEGRLVGNRSKQPQLVITEESKVPEVYSNQLLHQNSS